MQTNWIGVWRRNEENTDPMLSKNEGASHNNDTVRWSDSVIINWKMWVIRVM